MQGRGSGEVRDFALYGETTGETDEFGLPVRYNWAAEYRGPGDGRLRPHAGARAGVAQPHDQHRHRLRLRRQADGAALPRERSSSRSRPRRTYCEPARPFLPPSEQAPAAHGAAAARRRARRRGRARQADRRDAAAAQRHDPRGERGRGAGGDEPVRRRPEVADLPAADDVAVRDEPASRACWSIRPRRSPTTASEGVPRVVCEEKHMGSRAVVVVCRDEEAARRRFGVARRGDRHRLHAHRPALLRRRRTWKRELLDRVRAALDAAGFWERVRRPTGSASTAS